MTIRSLYKWNLYEFLYIRFQFLFLPLKKISTFDNNVLKFLSINSNNCFILQRKLLWKNPREIPMKSLGDRNRSKNGMQGYAKFHACPETQSRKNRTTISTWKRLENSGGNGGERAWREEKEKEFNLRRRGAGCANRWNLRKCETRAEDRGCFHLMHTYTPRSQRTYRFLNFLNTFVRKNKMDKKKKLCCWLYFLIIDNWKYL